MKSGFTLAEVLITLGIIGVVAAMTLPSVVANFKNQVYVTSLRKGMSVMSLAFSKMQGDEEAASVSMTSIFSEGLCAVRGRDTTDGFINENGCEERYGNPSVFQRIIPKYIKTVKTCVGSDCDIKYKETWNLSCNSNGKCKLNNSSATPQKLQSISYFSFGTVTGFYSTDGIIYYLVPGADSILVGVDTNGVKGPNEFGRDFFPMLFCTDGNGKLNVQYDSAYACYSDRSYIADRNMTPLKYLSIHGWKMDY